MCYLNRAATPIRYRQSSTQQKQEMTWNCHQGVLTNHNHKGLSHLFSIIWNVVVFSEMSFFWLSGPPYKCLPIYFTVGWKARRKTDFLLPSRLSKVTLLRSSGAATPTVKGLLAMGSPPNFTIIVISPCRRTHRADPTFQQLLHFKSMWWEDRMRRYVGFLILLKTRRHMTTL